MPVGDCEAAFTEAAASDGIALVRCRLPWLNQRGHLGLPPEARSATEILSEIFLALGGAVEAQASKRSTPLRGDYLHEPSGTLIEVDDSQHFTSARLKTLEFYPADERVGFDIEQYRNLCEEWAARSDRYFASKDAKGFGSGGRTRQRAFHDVLRDLAAPAMGRPPVIRVPALDRDGVAAYGRVRARLFEL